MGHVPASLFLSKCLSRRILYGTGGASWVVVGCLVGEYMKYHSVGGGGIINYFKSTNV